ncbi:MAG TPA: hypothetical protein VNN22_02580 [Verrucomicrobiae bacterium]|nr:hypothetical protein [Verrucomicrobiae bacterium]
MHFEFRVLNFFLRPVRCKVRRRFECRLRLDEIRLRQIKACHNRPDRAQFGVKRLRPLQRGFGCFEISRTQCDARQRNLQGGSIGFLRQGLQTQFRIRKRLSRVHRCRQQQRRLVVQGSSGEDEIGLGAGFFGFSRRQIKAPQLQAQIQVIGVHFATLEKKRRRLQHSPLIKINRAQSSDGLGVLVIIAEGVHVFDFRLTVVSGVKKPVGLLQVISHFCLRRAAGANRCQEGGGQQNERQSNDFFHSADCLLWF